MEKSKLPYINYAIDALLAVSFIIVFLTGIVKWPGLMPKLGLLYSSLPMQLFTQLHDWSGLIMGILVGIHLALHWTWITCMTKKIFFKR